MGVKVITISRQFGSGGHAIGQLVAEKLGIEFVDSTLLDKTVEKTGFSAEFIKEASEYATSASSLLFSLSLASYAQGVGLASPYDKIFAAQNKIIKDHAEEGPCVIVGRCADYVLEDYPECLHIFIHASQEAKIERVAKEFPDEKASPETKIKEMDRRRKAYYKHYTGRAWGQTENYHLSLDSGKLGLEACADIIVDLYKNLNR